MKIINRTYKSIFYRENEQDNKSLGFVCGTASAFQATAVTKKDVESYAPIKGRLGNSFSISDSNTEGGDAYVPIERRVREASVQIYVNMGY